MRQKKSLPCWILLVILLSAIGIMSSCEKSEPDVKVTTTVNVNGNIQTHEVIVARADSDLVIDYFWGPPSWYDTLFPMGASFVKYDGTEYVSAELLTWTGRWWELDTKSIELCVDSFLVSSQFGNVYIYGHDVSGHYAKFLQSDGSILYKATQDSSVYHIHTIKVL